MKLFSFLFKRCDHHWALQKETDLVESTYKRYSDGHERLMDEYKFRRQVYICPKCLKTKKVEIPI